MQITVEQSALERALKLTADIVEKRTMLPIMENLALEAESGQLTVTASDLDVEVRHQLDCTIQQSGAITTSARKLTDIVKRMPSGSQINLSINPENDQLSIKCGRSRYILPTLPMADFPILASQTYDSTLVVPSADLERLIQKTAFCVATDEVRHYLQGIFLLMEDDTFRAVATDGHKLSLCNITLPGHENAPPPSVIVPTKTHSQIAKMLATKKQDEATLFVSKTKIHMSYGTTSITSRVIDGTFPDYNRAIPKDNPYRLEVDKEPLIKAIERIAAISDERSSAIKLRISEKTLTLHTPTTDSTTGAGHEELDCQWSGEPDFSVGFASKLLLDIAKNISAKKIQLKLNTPTSAALITDPDDEDVMFVLMPMRVN